MASSMLRTKGVIQLAISLIFFLVSGWGFLWMLSSSSLASEFCVNEFSLFHEDFRCRQPYLAVLLWVISGVACLALLVVGIRSFKNR